MKFEVAITANPSAPRITLLIMDDSIALCPSFGQTARCIWLAIRCIFGQSSES
jgi:hypothetical protein